MSVGGGEGGICPPPVAFNALRCMDTDFLAASLLLLQNPFSCGMSLDFPVSSFSLEYTNNKYICNQYHLLCKL